MTASQSGHASSFIWCVAFAWCFGRGSWADDTGLSRHQNEGQFLLRRQPAVNYQTAGQVTPNIPVSFAPVKFDLETAISERLSRLQEEANLTVTGRTMQIKAVANRKKQEALEAMEKELPVAEIQDTARLQKELATQGAQLRATQDRNTRVTLTELNALKDHAEYAVNITARYQVRNAEKNVLTALGSLVDQAGTQIYQADLLAKEAGGAENYTKQAAEKSELWVKELPVEEAAHAVEDATKAEQEGYQLARKAQHTARTAKLAGNLALDTIKLVEQAEQYNDQAEQDIIKAAHQAAQNAGELNSIRDLISGANKIAQNHIRSNKS